MAASPHYRDEDARQSHRHGHYRTRIDESAFRLPEENRTGPRVRVLTEGEETVIQGTDFPASPAHSLREEGNQMSFLDDIALLRRGYINNYSRASPDGASPSQQVKPFDRPITLTELESRGLLINGQVVYTLPRGTKCTSKARPPLAPADASSTSRSWLSSSSDVSSAASVAALVNNSKNQKPTVKTGDLQRLSDGTMVEKIALSKGGVRYLIETSDRITTVEKRKKGSVIFSSLKGQ